ncbi:MAG: hypothetical protein M1812_002456 [Candelaria pacifica]|nr:MAG: hypothetical protein M1812_002456 [Candelaria pacifica]
MDPEPFELPGSPLPDFGPPGSGRPPPSKPSHTREDSTATNSSYSLPNLVRNSSPLFPQTPSRPQRNPPSNEGITAFALQLADIASPLRGQENMQPYLSRNPALTLSSVTTNPDQSLQQSPSDMASNRAIAQSTDDQSLLSQLLDANQMIGKAKNAEAHANRRAERYKNEVVKTREANQKRINELEDLLEKAQRTIQIQSNQLSGKTDQVPQTPQRPRGLQPQAPSFIATPAHQRYQYAADQQALPLPNTQPARGPMPYHPPTLQRQGTSNVSNTTHYSHKGPSRVPSGDVFTSAPQSSYPAVFQPQPTQGLHDATAVVPFRQSSPPKKTNFKIAFNDFFSEVESWAHKWASVPNPELDENLPETLKALLSSVCDRSLALPLLRDPATRYFLVARVVNSELTNNQLKFSTLQGYNLAVDMRLLNARDSLRADTPVARRRAIVEELANIALTVAEDVQHMEFLLDRTQQIAMEMMTKLAPLLGTGVNRAYAELHQLQKKTLLLAMAMLKCQVEWKVDFPKTGDYFVDQSMVNRDPFIAGDPSTLLRMRVKLGVTPVIIKRDQSGPSVIATQEHMPHVLLMK